MICYIIIEDLFIWYNDPDYSFSSRNDGMSYLVTSIKEIAYRSTKADKLSFLLLPEYKKKNKLNKKFKGDII